MSDESKKHHPLDDLRKQIDELDAKIIQLINDRANVVVEIGNAKRDTDAPIYAPDREQAVLKRIAALNAGPISQKTLAAIYRELMSGSFALEKPLRIGHLGPDGSFSHEVSMRKFGASVEYVPLNHIHDVFDAVQRGHCDMGVVPVENTTGGDVVDTLDLFVESSVHVIAEVIAEIHHNVLANCAPEEITAIASRPEVFAQCRDWLASQGRTSHHVTVPSSARAAEMATHEKGLAAIGSALAAELYGLKIVFANIEDDPKNRTRFFVIGNEPARPSGDDRTAIMFTTANRAGALAGALASFADNGVNLTNIASRPARNLPGEYYFFVEAEGHHTSAQMASAIADLKEHSGQFRLLGSFPRALDTI
jgi:chorismate mutase/prephenate dehydratase